MSQAGRQEVGALQEMLSLLQAAKRRLPCVQVVWIPSHLSVEEFVGAGMPQHAWAGNDAADVAAKHRAGQNLVPDLLVERVRSKQRRSVEVAHVVASVQLQRLQQRLRTEAGGAVKSRKRCAPGGLRRLRAPGTKRTCLRREEGQGRCLRDLLMPGVRASVSAAEASRLLEQAVAPAGFHDLWPLGPWPPAGTCAAKHGRLMLQWVCRTCGTKAGDLPGRCGGPHFLWSTRVGGWLRAALCGSERLGLLLVCKVRQAG